MSIPETVTYADVVQNSLEYDRTNNCDRLILQLIDTRWVQRLRDISQTANTRLVYMFAEHSRFGHSLGVERLAASVMNRLSAHNPEDVNAYRVAVSVAALLHDIGHIAPGSHTAYKTWFPETIDHHEGIGIKVLTQDPEISGLLHAFDPNLSETVAAILAEDVSVPPWTWEIISGGGWNVDRGNWCVVDSVMAGVSYGKYNIPALVQSIVLTPDKHLALQENRVDAMLHFAVSRHAMYKQIYQHRTLLSADMLNRALVARARQLADTLLFADPVMRSALAASTAEDLSLEALFQMREHWWRYHLSQWAQSDDRILADLADRLLHRRLFKTVRIRETDDAAALRRQAEAAVEEAGFAPEYYLHEISTVDMHTGDSRQAMPLLLDDGRVLHFSDVEPLFHTMVKESGSQKKSWLVMPHEAKDALGRKR